MISWLTSSFLVFLMNYLAFLFSMSVFSFSLVYLSDLFSSLAWVFLKTEFLFIIFCLHVNLQLCASHCNVFHVSTSFFNFASLICVSWFLEHFNYMIRRLIFFLSSSSFIQSSLALLLSFRFNGLWLSISSSIFEPECCTLFFLFFIC